ncbi:MAG: DUF58 domain-containing protein [Elusimicrobiales bacterium]|jgi:uncharacterized protein (DUF58 family)|nr:DUF58 domain-containing protein [Elusimicrobiales bacterium]
MNTAEILKKVRQIEIKTGRLVSETFAGQYQSIFKGRGVEFADVREYIPGDDIRTIDWNVSARSASSKIFVKNFIEERELTLLILCDISASQQFGSSGKPKSEAAAELAAMFAFSALKNSDKTGLLLFSDRTELYIPPRKGQNHCLRIIRELLAYEPQNPGTDVALALRTASQIMKRRGIIILISDFRTGDFSRELRLLSGKHDVIPVVVSDEFEKNLPEGNVIVSAETLEEGGDAVFDLADPEFRYRYRAEAEAFRGNLEETLRSAGTDWIDVDCSAPVYNPVIKYFRQRSRKFRFS